MLQFLQPHSCMESVTNNTEARNEKRCGAPIGKICIIDSVILLAWCYNTDIPISIVQKVAKMIFKKSQMVYIKMSKTLERLSRGTPNKTTSISALLQLQRFEEQRSQRSFAVTSLKQLCNYSEMPCRDYSFPFYRETHR